MIGILKDREKQILTDEKDAKNFKCEVKSVSGSVSQRACAFCGSRVVLYPIADALHLVHGPIGCAIYNWDIRGALSSGPELHRNSFSTDLREMDVIYGGEKKLEKTLLKLINAYKPKCAFVYSTCIVGVIGDDVEAVCRKVSEKTGIDVIPVASEGFKGTKKSGYAAACEAIFKLVGTSKETPSNIGASINILGDFNIAGELWTIRKYFERIGIQIIATITGDGRVDDIRRANFAKLNLVQCSGSMTNLAKMMKEKFGIPFKRVSFFGLEDPANAIYETAKFFNNEEILSKTQQLVSEEFAKVMPELEALRPRLKGRRAGLYVGGAFKAFSLIRVLGALGIETVLAGTQTGAKEDYLTLKELCGPNAVIVDDTNPMELAKFISELGVDIFIGGVKERPVAYKLGVAFCDHNHERKIPLAGFEGVLNFAKELEMSMNSPVWLFHPAAHKRIMKSCERK